MPALRRRLRAAAAAAAAARSCAFFFGLRLLRIVVRTRLHDAGIREEAVHAVGRGRALCDPGLRLFEVELEAVGMLARQQRIVEADLLDEAAVARLRESAITML